MGNRKMLVIANLVISVLSLANTIRLVRKNRELQAEKDLLEIKCYVKGIL